GLVAPGAPGLMKRTRLASLPLIVSWFAPGPAIVTLLETNNWPLVRVIVPETTVASMVSSSLAAASAARREPGPLSSVLVTVMVAASAQGRTALARAAQNIVLAVIS